MDPDLAGDLGLVFARVSGLLLSRDQVQTALSLLTSLVTETVPGTAGAGISLLDDTGTRTTVAATAEEVRRADGLQYQLDEGPCLTAWREHTVVRADDLRQEPRWPAWAEAAVEAGVGSCVSAPLVAGSRSLGALTIYGGGPGVGGDRTEHVLAMFASQAAVLLSNVRSAEDADRVGDALGQRLRGRDVISLAKGIVMGRDGVDEHTAFLTLVDAARLHRRTVRDEAERLAGATVRRRR